MAKGFFKLLVGVFGAVLAVLLTLQIAPGTMNVVVIIGVVGFFLVLIFAIMALAMVSTSRTQAEAMVRVSQHALTSQVQIAAISRASQLQLDRFLDAGGLVLENGGRYFLAAPGYQKPLPVEQTDLTEEEVDYLIENQQG